jgi:hypothetical protein
MSEVACRICDALFCAIPDLGPETCRGDSYHNLCFMVCTLLSFIECFY